MVKIRTRKIHRNSDNPILELRLPAWRSTLLTFIFLLSFVLLAGRAFYLQVINTDFLQEKGDSRYRRDIEIVAQRGRIIDRNGDLLAVSTPMRSVWAIPGNATLESEQLERLARLLEIKPTELSEKLNRAKTFVYLKRQIPPETAERIAALKLPGIHQDNEYRRYYPSGDMTSHLVGFTGIDDKGLEGVELAFQNTLIGHPGERTVIRDRRGQIVEDIGPKRQPRDGQDVHLAIDSRIQYMAYSYLKQAVSEQKAKAGGVIVVNARNGEILALANWPTYNPNDREQLTGSQVRNRAVTDSFEPGSTFKPFTAALALDKGRFKPESQINCAPGRMTIGRATIHDSHPHGVLSVSQVVQKSSNIGMAKMAATLSSEEMWQSFDALGFGRSPGLGFPGEVTGRLRPWKQWRPIEQATMAYGHGISVSLIQLARAYTVFARNGDIVPLSILQTDSAEIVGSPVFSPQTAQSLRVMLEMAVGPGGTAKRAQIPGYRVAGKTGTAYKLENGAYTRKYISSFIGFAPASNPHLIVAVMLDEPSAGKYYGGEVAAPVFSQVMGSALRTLGIAPDADFGNRLKVARRNGAEKEDL